MSSLMSMISALRAAGVPAEQILNAIEIQHAAKLQKDKERKRISRAKPQPIDFSECVSVDTVENADTADTPPPLGFLSPTPPIFPNSPPKEKPPKGGKKKVPLPDWIPTDAWDGFVEMRVKIKKPMTDRAIKLAVGKLERFMAMGHDPAEVLNQSTLNDWQDLYEPKGDKNAYQRNNQKPTFKSERERLAAKYAAEAEREEQAAISGDSGENLRIAEAIRQEPV